MSTTTAPKYTKTSKVPTRKPARPQVAADKPLTITHTPRNTEVSRVAEVTDTRRKRSQPIEVDTQSRAIPRNALVPSVKALDKEFDTLTANVSPEQEYLNEYILLYKRLKVLVRASYKKCVASGSSRDYYALCTLISQQREVIADIRVITDLSAQVQLVIDSALQPMVSAIAQLVVNSYYQNRQILANSAVPNKTQDALTSLEQVTQDLSAGIQQQYSQTAERIYQLLACEAPSPSKKKRR
jgi:hypothetical protein